jgi:hypothetical protein
MTEDEKFQKVLTIQNSLWTAICCIDEVLQAENVMPHQLNQKNVHLVKTQKDLLVAKSKVDPIIDRLNKNLDFLSLDFSNQISYRIEDLVTLSYEQLSKGN